MRKAAYFCPLVLLCVVGCRQETGVVPGVLTLKDVERDACGIYRGDYAGGREIFVLSTDLSFRQVSIVDEVTNQVNLGSWRIREMDGDWRLVFSNFVNREKVIFGVGRAMLVAEHAVTYEVGNNVIKLGADNQYQIIRIK